MTKKTFVANRLLKKRVYKTLFIFIHLCAPQCIRNGKLCPNGASYLTQKKEGHVADVFDESAKCEGTDGVNHAVADHNVAHVPNAELTADE